MKFFPIPDARGKVTRAQLDEMRSLGIVQASISAYADRDDWTRITGIGLPSEGTNAKYWRDNSALWRPEENRSYLFLMRDPDGSYTKMPLGTMSDSTWSFYSPVAANFYNQRRRDFPFIPKIARASIPRAEAARLNMAADGFSADYPIGIFTNDTTHSFPTNMALRFNPQTGQPEAFFIEEYVKEFPSSPSTAGGTLTDAELIYTVGQILSSGLSDSHKATAIRRVATS